MVYVINSNSGAFSYRLIGFAYQHAIHINFLVERQVGYGKLMLGGNICKQRNVITIKWHNGSLGYIL